MASLIKTLCDLTKCKICRSEEHRSRDCPELCPCNEYHTSADHKCHICGLIGFEHEVADCPELCPCGSWHNPINHKCHICGLIGFEHELADCPELCPCKDYHTSAEHKCFVCEIKGYTHSSVECPERCGQCSLMHTTSDHGKYTKLFTENDHKLANDIASRMCNRGIGASELSGKLSNRGDRKPGIVRKVAELDFSALYPSLSTTSMDKIMVDEYLKQVSTKELVENIKQLKKESYDAQLQSEYEQFMAEHPDIEEYQTH